MSDAESDFATVVVAYNRVDALKKLLRSVLIARESSGHNGHLIVSVDGGTPDVVKAAGDILGDTGEIIARDSKLGLREHVLACGDLTERYENVLVLEDDLLVSPIVYDVIDQVLPVVRQQPDVAAFSLYSFHYNEYAQLPLLHPDYDSDIFYARTGSSWGQVWWREKWQDFRQWLEHDFDESKCYRVPASVRAWPATSWKRLYNFYLSDRGHYSAVLRYSLTLNAGTEGTHHINGPAKGFGPIRTLPWSVRSEPLPSVRLDEFLEFEVHDPCDIEIATGIPISSVEFDYYSIKDQEDIRRPYVLTSQPQAAAVRIAEFELTLGNPLYAAVSGTDGQGLSLVRREDFRATCPSLRPEGMVRNYLAWIRNMEMLRFVILESVRKLSKFWTRLVSRSS